MKISEKLLRSAAIMAVGLAVFGATVTITTPSAEAAVMEKKNAKAEKNDSGSGISDVPIIGDLVGGFEGQEPEEGTLGDIVLCPSVATKQAAEAGHAAMEEMLLLTTHGILHLLGYDHAEADDEKEMFELQRQLLLTFLATRGRPTA